MFELNWAELLIIGFLALIVIGPEDLPAMFRQLGRFTSKLRQMSREFSRAMEDAAKQSGMKDAADDLKAATSAKSLGLDAVREAADKFEKWDPIKNAVKPASPMPARSLIPPPMPATPAPVVSAAVVVDDASEAADDLAAHDFDAAQHGAAQHGVAQHGVAQLGAAESAPRIHGPATQALYDKQALRTQVLQEQTEKLKAIEAGTYARASAAPTVPPDLATLGMTRPRVVNAVVNPVVDLAVDSVASEVDGPVRQKRATVPKAAKAKVTAEAPDAVGLALEPKKKTSRKTASKADKT